MGFGIKTDFESGRKLDLDATYEAIIKPAAEGSGLRCIRADEILHSGTIDTEMYEMLLRADLVIADLSTGNVNAVYELGVRHALTPNATILMKEQEGRLYFDLNHTSMFNYEHLGSDIGSREATRAVAALKELIASVLRAERPDSPVYTYLPKLQRPRLTEDEYTELLLAAEAAEEKFSTLIKRGQAATRSSAHDAAVEAFSRALKVKPGDPYLTQQLSLNTYKSRKPSELTALIDALTIIAQLRPDDSNDPETLGISGAIHKRLWFATKDVEQLNLAIRFYGRGFEVSRDYYNGENLATCLDLRASIQTDGDEIKFDRMSALKVRESIIRILEKELLSASFDQRLDKRWVYASLANSSFALGREMEGQAHEAKFLNESPAQWEIETYNEGKTLILNR
jgi:tetratricopeptide (TPR) repeat protein